MKIVIKTEQAERLYIAGKMQPIVQSFYLSDGWKLLADNIEDAKKEADAYGVKVTGVEVEH